MGKSSRAYGSREIKGQRREVLAAVEAQFGNEAELKRQAAMEKVLLGPPVPGVNKGPARGLYSAAMEVDAGGNRQGGAVMEVAAEHPVTDGLDPAEARMRRVMGSVTGYAIKKPRQQLKKMAMLGVHGPGKRAIKAAKKALKRGGGGL